MIKTENFQIDGQDFVRTYSDDNHYVVRDGISYSEAIDPAYLGRTYTEGEELPDEEISEEEAGRILMGVDT